MALQTPLQITLYDPETDEVKANYSRVFVPWKVLKYAVNLAKNLDAANMTEEQLDQLAALIVEAFGNRFSIQDLNDGADISEMMTVLNQIIAKARGGEGPLENPPTPQPPP